jgi:predicted outer membrane repeat protein
MARDGGAIGLFGLGLSDLNHNSYFNLTNFTSNRAYFRGGVIYSIDSDFFTFSCHISNNSAIMGAFVYYDEIMPNSKINLIQN